MNYGMEDGYHGLQGVRSAERGREVGAFRYQKSQSLERQGKGVRHVKGGDLLGSSGNEICSLLVFTSVVIQSKLAPTNGWTSLVSPSSPLIANKANVVAAKGSVVTVSPEKLVFGKKYEQQRYNLTIHYTDWDSALARMYKIDIRALARTGEEIINSVITCIITDNASMTYIPDEMNSGKNIPVQAAIAAKAPPKAKAPVSPINTEALYRLCKRKPTHAPAIDAPNTARSE
ncbi:hypothetical protein RJ639_028355 [Escallonia herrerae]|uniref:Uncharacterized protein n=1 Tax=Escallonia herrerae TaxID=1293975 RepID=A0AA88X2L5_9ASTE|nr:hypothetical protein RJ639_028355 [Escallonia herrerae]